MNQYIKEHFLYLTRNSKYPGLDLLRTIAVLSVVFFHTIYNEKLSTSIFRIGWIGVDLFFVLSGFLVGGILFDMYKKNSYNLRTFYIHRFLRIYPVYVFILFFTIAFNYWQNRIDSSMNDIVMQFILNLSLLHTYFDFLFGFDINPYFNVGGGLVTCYRMAVLPLISFIFLVNFKKIFPSTKKNTDDSFSYIFKRDICQTYRNEQCYGE